MSSAEDRLNSSAISAPGQKRTSGLLRIPGLVAQHSPVDQSPFPETPTQPVGVAHPLAMPSSADATRQLPDLVAAPGVTGNLPEVQTGSFSLQRVTTAALRQPMVIPGNSKKSKGTIKPPRGRRWVIQIAATITLVLIASAALLAVSPAGIASEINYNPFRPFMSWVQGNNNNPSLLAMQAATVTAVTRDGYQPPKPYSGLPSAPPGVGSYDGFTFGQCTYWADYYYHELTGYWVPWGGDAWLWASGARSSGWVVSSSPHVPSIIVLQPYVQGASGYGHVAVVTAINGNSVTTSNMNWYAGGGGWDRVSTWTFQVGSGVSFVWR